MSTIKKYLKTLFCKHKYHKIYWYEEYDKYSNERYSVRVCRCEKCGKEIHIDGRYNYYDSYYKY